MKKLITFLMMVVICQKVFSQGTVVNGTVFNQAQSGAPINGSIINLYVSLVYLNTGNPNDLQLIGTAPVNANGTYSIVNTNNNLNGTYKTILVTNPIGSLVPQAPAGFIFYEDYLDAAPDGISGTFILARPLCIGSPGDAEYDECIAAQALPITLNGVNFKLNQIPLNAGASLSSNSPVCVGGTLNFIVDNPSDYFYTITGPNGQAVNSLSITNVTAANAGTYTITSDDGMGGMSMESFTSVIVNPLPPNITFTSGATSLPVNSPNIGYTTDAPNTYTVSYTISPSNSGTINSSGVVDWNDTFAGQATITASITNSCGPKTATRLVNIVAPLFTPAGISSNSPVCEGGTLTLVVENSSNFPYSITGPNGQPVTNLTIANVTATNAGTYTITSDDGMGGMPGTNSITVVVNNSPPDLNFISGPNVLRQYSFKVNYYTDAPSNYNPEYTLTPPEAGLVNEVPNSNGIGRVEWAGAFSGDANLTAKITNGCGFKTATKAIKILPVLNASFTSNSPVCEGNTLSFNVQLEGVTSFYMTGPNGSQVPSYDIENVTINQAGIYKIFYTDPQNNLYIDSTTVVINQTGGASAPELQFNSYPNSLLLNPSNTMYSTNAPNNLTVSYDLFPKYAGTINAAGEVDWANNFVGTASITASINSGCGGSIAKAYTRIDYPQCTPTIAPPINFTAGATSLVQNAANETYAIDAPQNSIISFMLSPSIAGTVSENGEVDWSENFVGQAMLTAQVIGSCDIKDATINITITSAPPAVYSLGNTVFNDQNLNGTQDSGEPGINNVTVKLYAADGLTILATTTTDNNGNYVFENLPVGDYKIGATPNPQQPISSPNIGTSNADNQTDLDDNGTQTSPGAEAISPIINLSAADGTGDMTIDFGFNMAPLVAPASMTSNSPVCAGGTLSFTVNNPSDLIYTITGPNGQVSTTINNVTASMAGNYTITSYDNFSQEVGSETINVVINPLAPAIAFTSGATILDQNAANETYATDAPNNFTVSYGISPSNAGTISPTGVVDWDNAFHGQATITASITNSCDTKTATQIVMINCVAPLFQFSLSSNSPICEGQTLLLTPNLEGLEIEYTITGPNGQPSATTILNTALSNAGNYTISTTNGCGQTISDQVNVVINPLAPEITFTSGATSLDQNAANETYATNAPNNFTVTYGISPSNAGTINATGTVDWDMAFFGTATITASIANTCNSQTVSRLVSIAKVSPLINCPVNILIPVATGVTSAIASFTLPTIADATVVQTSGPASGSSFPFGNTTISLEATNNLGNTATCSFVVAVYPESAPLVENSQIPNAVPDPATGNYSISSTIFDVTVPSGETISGLLITTFPAGAESITINGITYGPPTGLRIKAANAKTLLTPFPPGGVVATTNDAGVPDEPILVNPKPGSTVVEIEFFAISGDMQSSPLPATVTVNFTSGPLPITLLSFTGKQENETVVLNWKTSNETNFFHFEIERSPQTSGGKLVLEKFRKIGQQTGNESENYEFQDSTPPLGVGGLYRLKMVDLDGKFTFSKIISVQFKGKESYLFVENPAKGGEFCIQSDFKNPDFTLINGLGRKLEINTSQIIENKYKIKANNLATGIYYLLIQTDGRMITRKVLME